MLPKTQDLRRAAARLVQTLMQKDLLEPNEKPDDLERRVFQALERNVEEEAAIDREAERLMVENQRQTTGMDQRKMLLKIKEKLARDRGFIL
ncbi:MAG: hypothetical protein QOD06_2080 [Candidatus Binatota bacterium]|nr:hypothetical protein [Candidatus Binatota bacterium]